MLGVQIGNLQLSWYMKMGMVIRETVLTPSVVIKS
jgi:hypothetical protein